MTHLVDIMMVKDAVKIVVNVIQHVHHLHGRAVVAECGKTHNVTKVDADFIKELRLHASGFL